MNQNSVEGVHHEEPYCLDIQGGSMYHVHPDNAKNYVDNSMRGTPFDANEERLQYVSFMAPAWNPTLLIPVGAWDDGNGGILKNPSQRPIRRMPEQREGKRISFTEYQRKLAGKLTLKAVAEANKDHKVQDYAVVGNKDKATDEVMPTNCKSNSNKR